MTYSYDANNKLTQLVGPSGTTTFGYDSNGNMTGMNLPDETDWTYGYDYENRLVSVTDNADYTAAYTYSPDGLRLRVQESNHAYPDRWFQYDGVRPVLEGTLSGDTFTTVNPYVWEGDDYYSPLIHADFNGEPRYFLYDGIGSTRQLLDDSQDITDSYQYEAFGNVLSDGGPTPNPYRYVGSLGYYQIYPPAGGPALMHLGARYYMPEVGRFVRPDPVGHATRHYEYADNGPALRLDPSGLSADGAPPYPPWRMPGGGPLPEPPHKHPNQAYEDCMAKWTSALVGDPAQLARCTYDCFAGCASAGNAYGTVGGGIAVGVGGGLVPIGGWIAVGAAAGTYGYSYAECRRLCGLQYGRDDRMIGIWDSYCQKHYGPPAYYD